MTTEPELMTAAAVADAVGVTRQHANRLINSGALGPVSEVVLTNPPQSRGKTAKAVSREHVLTYIAERSPPPGTISLKDAAERLGTSPKRVYQLGRTGALELVEFKHGSVLKYHAVRLSSLEEYMA